MNFKTGLAALALTGFLSGTAVAQTTKEVVIQVDKPYAKVQPTMWGIFFEDINLGADGGLYAEMVKNRSFEFTTPLMGWAMKPKKWAEGSLLVQNRQQADTNNPRFIRVTAGKDSMALSNDGFRGMGVKKGLRYDFSVWYRQQQPGVKMRVELVDSTGKSLGGTVFTPTASDKDWHRQAVVFNATETVLKAKLNIWFTGPGVIDLDMISLFPEDTWKKRPGGLRGDMVQLLADMKPGFIRFPGGCIVEGRDLANRYQWKTTVGPVEQRKLIMNRWNNEFAHRPAPDYFQSFGLGFFEYFQLAEDIGASPLPILNCGMACQFNTGEVSATEQLDPYIQDALDLIEFANGTTTSKWGKLRADMGHPAPFNLKMMGVGNENWGPQYLERLQEFTQAIKSKYPDIKLVNSSGTDPDGDRFNLLNTKLRKMNADFIDEHYYRAPEWFLQNAGRYDNYPRKGSKVFAGEYAAHTKLTNTAEKKNNWQSALAEAAFMTGLERNADVVQMASYAPLFAHIDGWQWAPDLIWVNNLESYGTPDYYVQKLYSLNKGTDVVPALINGEVVKGQDSLYISSTINVIDGHVIVKITNASQRNINLSLNFAGVKTTGKTAEVTMLHAASLEQVNSFQTPKAIIPVSDSKSVKNQKTNISVNGYSFYVVRVPIR